MAQLKEGSIIKKSTGDEVIATLNDIVETSNIPIKTSELENDSGFLTTLPIHNHNDLYYTESEVNTLLSSKAESSTVSGHTGNTTVHVTSGDKVNWNNKQNAIGYTPANATNEHTHTNKSTIDKFSEVDNKPYYNGEEIGVGTSAIIKSEEIISTEGQTVFTLTKGNYTPNENKLAIYIWGVKQHSNAFIETSTASFTLSSGLKAGDRVIAEWFETSPSIKGDKGEKGTGGVDGYTPQKGVDYYTNADKAEMVSAVLAALPVYEGEVESV